MIQILILLIGQYFHNTFYINRNIITINYLTPKSKSQVEEDRGRMLGLKLCFLSHSKKKGKAKLDGKKKRKETLMSNPTPKESKLTPKQRPTICKVGHCPLTIHIILR